MTHDIQHILDSWEYQGPHRLTVRRIRGRDGKVKIQLRLDVGLLQMEATGRPDGTRPYGQESLLDHFQQLAAAHRLYYGTEEGFELDREDCAALHRESMQYYHRRICYLELGDYEAAARDAEHNLQIMDLLRDYAADRNDWWASEQYRAFVLSHWIKAKAMLALEAEDYDGALEWVQKGQQMIEHLFTVEYGRPDLLEQRFELEFLQELEEYVRQRRPLTPRELLERKLAEAVAREEFERAAVLRDQLRAIEEGRLTNKQ